MDLNSPVAVALIAASVSVVGTLLTVRAAARTNHNAAVQTQFQEIIKKRIECYPKLWEIHIRYETNWALADRPKTREWAEQYAHELNNFNLTGGVFFSQPVYVRFGELRHYLSQAVHDTPPGAEVSPELTYKIRLSVYGGPGYGDGMSTHLKDDLGSYQSVSLTQAGKTSGPLLRRAYAWLPRIARR
ncbi:hypothetical protein ABT127_19700 [Streptomyces sp. NPDC001904]|uniref:hypothetical protein n=1 Tax=Streptomyces sp. NPDC001904 TaxID=3154531 RepID=UPI0033191F92